MGDKELIIEGARQNNLKAINLRLPHDKITVITGLSGSGKSSLAFDTLFAEGQWRYIESLSTYSRQFLEKLDRPDVDYIGNIRPAVAVEQKNPVRTSRSTVGTATELYDYFRLLYARIGKTFCPDCGQQARVDHPSQVVERLIKEHSGDRVYILFPVEIDGEKSGREMITRLLERGFIRLKLGDVVKQIHPGMNLEPGPGQQIQVVLDRLILRADDRTRLADSLDTAFSEGRGKVYIEILGKQILRFSSRLHCPRCGREFEQPHPLLFSFNHPVGACPQCKGFGNLLLYDEDLIVPDKSLSLAQGAIEPWTKPSHRWWYHQLEKLCRRKHIDMNKPFYRLTEEEKRMIFEGTDDYEGVYQFFVYLEEKRYKLPVRVFLSRYRSQFTCPDCQGSRLRPQALWVKVAGFDIHQLSQMSIEQARGFFSHIRLSNFDQAVAGEVLKKISAKLELLYRTGLGYLTLDRQTRTLSGGEAQRVNIANQLSARLAGTLYVLDEPTIGLHVRDTHMLVDVLKDLASTGNTLIVVEHDRKVIEKADYLVELGPLAGEKGGRVVYAGDFHQFVNSANTVTAKYLRGEKRIPLPSVRRKGSGRFLKLTGARSNNLKNIDIEIPLHTFTCVTGVSGSGKSTLIHDTLYHALGRVFKSHFEQPGEHDSLTGTEWIKGVRMIDQAPIASTPRSNPITFIGAFDHIRRLFASLPYSKRMGFGPGHFSYNVPGGRCEVCQGEGYLKLDMYFLADVYVTCEQCQGKRYKSEILKVKYRGRNISDVLGMTVDEAVDFFTGPPALARKLKLLSQMGLGYLRLGQPATTLSGGEAQRLKIAAELMTRSPRDMLYILDEPTTGLHLDDIKKLISVLNRLVDAGNTVLVIEHNLDVIKTADWIIDLGPEGGEKGGRIVAVGTPEHVAQVESSYTGKYLRPYLAE